MARFSVDPRNHLLSMLTMLGPSPDWCVGVSALDMCLPNCTWAGDQTIDLFPWDAGTDDGLTYMVRKTEQKHCSTMSHKKHGIRKAISRKFDSISRNELFYFSS